MRKDTEWATELELFAAATLLHTPIIIFTTSAGNQQGALKQFQFLTHDPLFDTNGRPWSHTSNKFNECVFLTLLGNHFERIVR